MPNNLRGILPSWWFACSYLFLSHAGQNYWILIGWERGHFSKTMRALLVIKRAWSLDADWLSMPALSWFPASNRFLKGISETHCFWVRSKHGCFNLTWKKINMQQGTVFWWKRKRIFRPKMYWFATWKKFEWVWLVLHKHRVLELHKKLISSPIGHQIALIASPLHSIDRRGMCRVSS